MGVSENSGTPKSSNLIGISIINRPFWGTPIFGNTYMIPLFFVSILPSTKRRGTWPCFGGSHPGGKEIPEKKRAETKIRLEKDESCKSFWQLFCAFGLGFMESLREMSHEI